MRLAALWTCAVLYALANPVWAQGASDSLYRAARAEGEITFGGAIKDSAAEEISKAFAKRYPGIRISYSRRSTDEMVKSVEVDRKAGKVKFDLINVTESADLLRWKAQGFLARVPLAE